MPRLHPRRRERVFRADADVAGAVTVNLVDGTVVVASATATSTAANQMIAIPLTATLKGSRCSDAKVLSLTASAAGTTGPTSVRVTSE